MTVGADWKNDIRFVELFQRFDISGILCYTFLKRDRRDDHCHQKKKKRFISWRNGLYSWSRRCRKRKQQTQCKAISHKCSRCHRCIQPFQTNRRRLRRSKLYHHPMCRLPHRNNQRFQIGHRRRHPFRLYRRRMCHPNHCSIQRFQIDHHSSPCRSNRNRQWT